MDSDIRIVCIQVSPEDAKASPVSPVPSGQRGEIRAVLERAREALDASGGSGDRYEAHLRALMSRALPGGRTASLPLGLASAVPSESDAEASQGVIVKVTA